MLNLLNAAFDLGQKWRAEAEASPVFDIRVASNKPPMRARHGVTAIDLAAVLTRDEGYFTHEDRLLPDEAFERCFHFALAYGSDVLGWAHRHDLTRAFCEGAFGMWLPEVWVQAPPPPGLAKRGDGYHDRWRFRLFVAADWQTPIRPKILRQPATYIRWEQYRAAVLEAAT